MNGQKERGAAAVEFALVVPLLLLLALGIAEFGRVYHVQTMLSQAAREGVRVKAIRDDSAEAVSATQAAAGSGYTLNNITVTPSTCVVSGTATPPTATVTVTYSLPFLTGMFGSGVTLTGKGVMRCNG